jgi:DNA invertase Pin-like site-specific DNA recombinase
MNAVAYLRCSTEQQDYARQKSNLEAIAKEKGWVLQRTFAEKISGNVKADERREFKSLLTYVKESGVRLVMVSEISRLGRRVVDVLNQIETLHSNGVALYVQQFGMTSLDQNGKENPTVKLLMQMMSIGAEMENNLRKERQRQGISIAKANGKYKGRIKGSKMKPAGLTAKYWDVVNLLKDSDLSINKISQITKRSVNTVRKVKELI